MSDQPERTAPEEEQAARLTAFVLGELSEDEQRRMEANLDESMRGECEEVERLAVALLKSDRVGSLPEASGELREAIGSRLANDAVTVSREKRLPANRPRRRLWLTLATGLALLLAVVSVPFVSVYNLSRIPKTELAQLTATDAALQAEAKRADDRLASERASRRFALSDLESRQKELTKRAATGGEYTFAEQSAEIKSLRQEVRIAQQDRDGKFESLAALDSTTEAVPRSPSAYGNAYPKGQQPATTSGASLNATPYYVAPQVSRDAGVEAARVTVGGQTLPSPHYLTDDIQYFAPGPEFKLTREAAAMKAVSDLDSLSQLGRANIANEQYAQIVENRFASVRDEPLSTFSIDVDTASYANARRFLAQNQLPPANAIRIEEFINYFNYDYPAPKEGEPFSVNMEVAQCPWQPAHQLVRIGLKGKEFPQERRPASNVVFLLDVSGSMQDANKLPLLKQAMKLLTDQLTENDRVSIVTYAGNAGLALNTTNGESKQTIRDAIDALNANGSTNGSAGIQLAYEKATESFLKEGANRVILATDGDLNVGVTSDDALVELIKQKAASGVFLTVLGFGEGNLKDGKLEKLADNGNGMYAYIDSLREARKVLVEQLSGSLVTIAKDVKIKVEFNPAEVAAYRLLGYENRLMSAPDFDNDAKDAGEIGAGHTVTALYEIVPTNAPEKLAATAVSLKYQRPVAPTEPPKALTDAAKTGELLTLFLRYKQPDANESTLSEFTVANKQRAFDDASPDFRFAAAVASFGMVLRNSEFRGSSSLADIEQIASSAIGSDPQGHRTELLDLVRKASTLQPQQR
ncbi:MAG: VWA domain-containing protein [Planctomycetota bacterium]|nr:VWA domain-containing protein [Planctomycetota bacterium]